MTYALALLPLCFLGHLASTTRATRNDGQSSAIYTFLHGEVSVSIISDGALFPGTPYAAPAIAVNRSYEFEGRSISPLVFGQNVVLLDMDVAGHRHRVLVDTGTGPSALLDNDSGSGALKENLQKACIDLNSVTDVIVTHGHVDHVGGLVDERKERVFRNAMVHVPRVEDEFWRKSPKEIGSGLVFIDEQFGGVLGEFYVNTLEPYVSAGKVTLTEPGEQPLPGVELVATPGHSPGHVSVKVTSEGKVLFVTGDVFAQGPGNIQNPDWVIVAASSVEESVSSRYRTLDMLADEKVLTVTYHEDFPGLGHVVRTGPAFDWMPLKGLGVGSNRIEQCSA